MSVHEMRSDLRHCSRGVHQDENPTGPNKKVVYMEVFTPTFEGVVSPAFFFNEK